jgi:hypothetical protein
MKRVFLFLIALIISVSSYSQSKKDSLINSLPAYYVDNGDTIGIILSIEQAQQIDNDEELIHLLETMKISCDSVISKYVVVVNEYDRKIGILNMKIHKLEEINKSQSELVDNLKAQIDNYKTDLRKAEEHQQTAVRKGDWSDRYYSRFRTFHSSGGHSPVNGKKMGF